jgi:predicted metal-dependent phosphoesterase TrpH
MDSWMRADMHLHTSFSGWRRMHFIKARDCYVSPEAAFATARRRGMDYVCFTDHNTIDGALDFLSRHPEEEPRVIVGEELEVLAPGSTRWIHLGIYDIDERIHDDLRRLRPDGAAVMDYLDGRGVLYALNHPFQSFRSAASARRHLAGLLARVPAVEVCNSTTPRSHQRAVETLLDACGTGRPAPLGGSDAHTGRRIAAAYTCAPGRSKTDFLASIRRGECRAGGAVLGLPALIADVYQIVGSYYLRQYGIAGGDRVERDLGSIPGSIVLLPAAIAGLPAILTALHIARQEWIARTGPWAKAAQPEADESLGALSSLTPDS